VTRVLLVNPPISDPSGPYPSICYLAGFLDTLGITADLADASLMLMLRLFSRTGLHALHEDIGARVRAGSIVPDESVRAFLARFHEYVSTVDTAIACLQGTQCGAVARANQPGYFPTPLEAPAAWAQATSRNLQNYEALLGGLSPAQRARIASMPRPLQFAFGTLGETDEARFRASCVIGDLARVIRTALDPEFTLDGYADRLPDDLPTFAPIRARLEAPPGLVDRFTDDIAGELLRTHRPDVVGLTVPFPGSVYGALRIARRVKALDPRIRTILGGGWVNANLRELTDAGIFDYVDFITLDDGERPLQCLLEMFEGRRTDEQLFRTFIRRDGRVVQVNGAGEADVPFVQTGVPTYRGLRIHEYLTLRAATSMRPRIGGRRWNKLTLAHGCYWKKCAFCDTQLDYIGRYEPASLDVTIARIRSLVAETGETGFHFVDEAMPPAMLDRLAERLIGEDLPIAWWGNVRFDRKLEPMAARLARSGCIAITGGLEVASDRLLALMQKGVSLEQAGRVTHALSRAGMSVHAYLIYGFPTQTAQETIDALEYVRQLFEAGCLHSVAWHRFMLTKFSPIALDPARFSIRIRPRPLNPFSNCVLHYDEPGGVDHDQFTAGLEDAAYAYMAGLGWDRPVESWFSRAMPTTTLPPDFVTRIVSRKPDEEPPAPAPQRWALSVTS
jgi:Radical SAM superfamily